MTEPTRRSAVPALERGLNLLQLFDRRHVERGAPEIARLLGLPRVSVFRLLQTLEAMGFLEKHGANFRLGPAVLRLGFEYLASLEITDLARPIVEKLRDDTGCAAQLVVRDGRDVVVVLRATSASMFASNVHVGTRFPAHATVLGRCLICELDDEALATLFPEKQLKTHSAHTPKTVAELSRLLAADRRRGHVVSEAFFEAGICAVAAPVRDRDGRIVAAVSVTAQRPNLSPRTYRDELVGQVVAAAESLSRRLDWNPSRSAA